MKSIMMVTKVTALVVFASSSASFADLAGVSTVNGNAAADALSRIAASRHFEGPNIAAIDPGTNLGEDVIYYSSSSLKIEEPDLGPGGPTGNGGLGFTNPGENGVIDGGGAGGSVTGPVDNGRVTPSPGAALLALIGMCCIGRARRRV